MQPCKHTNRTRPGEVSKYKCAFSVKGCSPCSEDLQLSEINPAFNPRHTPATISDPAVQQKLKAECTVSRKSRHILGDKRGDYFFYPSITSIAQKPEPAGQRMRKTQLRPLPAAYRHQSFVMSQRARLTPAPKLVICWLRPL